jgi:hypothetical protein
MRCKAIPFEIQAHERTAKLDQSLKIAGILGASEAIDQTGHSEQNHRQKQAIEVYVLPSPSSVK